MSKLPGSIWNNAGRWNWKVKLPGSDRRKNYPLRLPNQKLAISSERDRSVAESVAWRMLEQFDSHGEDQGELNSFNDVAGAYLAEAKVYYRNADGEPTSEAARCAVALRYLREVHGAQPIDDITYRNVLDCRKRIAKSGLSRNTVNAYVGIWKRFFEWALEERLCSPQTKAEVWAMSPLKKNRSAAGERDPVRPVCADSVRRTAACLPPVLRAMIAVHELCGARPGEMCAMRGADIDRSADVWVYRPSKYKTKHLGLPRVVCLGPRAQKLLGPLLDAKGPGECIFSPSDAMRERAEVKRRERKSDVQPSQIDRRKDNPEHVAGAAYDTNSYRRAVLYACQAAGVEPWSPNQLRHNCGTRVRERFGVAAAAAVLGHASGQGHRVTDGYTHTVIEMEFVRDASAVMAVMG